jgi:ABC-2 type transport system ATP-binding protein
VTSLVGPNGAGKTTLLNLMTGLVRASRGRVSVLGTSPADPEALGGKVGYCTQVDAFPAGASARSFLRGWLRLAGRGAAEAESAAAEALERVGLTEAADRRIAGYSKGMRQRVRLALALSHRPEVLALDEPLNGLDPMARAESLALFQALGREGLFVVVSSHILHEVDRISDHVVLLSQGYVVAEGRIHAVRGEVKEHPMQVFVRCDEAHRLAAGLLAETHVVEVKLHADGRGLLARTQDASAFHRLLNRVVLESGLDLEAVGPADDDVGAVYQYLVGSDTEAV